MKVRVMRKADVLGHPSPAPAGARLSAEPCAVKAARTVVRPGKADVSSRSQSCRGKNRKPRSWEGKAEGKPTVLKPLDNLTCEGECKLLGRNDGEREVAPKVRSPGGRARNREGEGSTARRNRSTRRVAPAGWLATARRPGYVEQLEKPSSSRPERAEAG